MVHTIVLFSYLARFLRTFIRIKAVKLSKPEVGSSKKNTSGSFTNSKPIEHLFLSPPDIPFKNFPPMYVC